MHNRLTKQKSITEFWTKSQAPHAEVGIGIEVGGELESGRGVGQLPDLPLKVQRRVEHSQERKDSQQSKKQCRLEQYFKPKDPEGTVLRLTQEKGSTFISKKRTDIGEQNKRPCKKQALVENVGSGAEE